MAPLCPLGWGYKRRGEHSNVHFVESCHMQSYNCFSSYELFVICFFYLLPDMKYQETKIPKVKAPTPKTPNTIIDGKHSTYSV